MRRSCVLALLFLCGSCGKNTVQTEQGTFLVPGAARVRGGATEIVIATMENGCEHHGGTSVAITDTREKDGRRTFRIDAAQGCPAGWIDARHLVPVAPKPE